VRWCQLESDISGRINRLEGELAGLRSEIKSLKRTLKYLHQLSTKVDEIKREIKSLKRTLKYLHQLSTKVDEIKREIKSLKRTLKATRQELSRQINAVGSKVMEVDDHLSQQDKVLEHNSEALLNNLAMQYVLNIIDRVASSHIVVSYLNEKPFIIIETTEYVELILISTEVSKEDLKTLNKLSEALSEYVDKEVKYKILTTRVTRSETPVWLYFPRRTQ
jgi:prefoldin subunit 5